MSTDVNGVETCNGLKSDSWKAAYLSPNLSRPSFHVTAPSGWLNDPCGPGYDPSTGLYHLFFQWNPHGNNWGNMSWGHATSVDMANWKTSPQPALVPTTDYDHCGVFTGCLRATDIDGNPGALTIVYTSVNRLPIHYRLPYARGSETLSLAVSRDGGKIWERPEYNPILLSPPEDVSVTGWRDPSLAMWSPGCQSGSTNKHPNLYGVLSGGIVGQSPTVFLYNMEPTDLRKWLYAGFLVDVGLNFCPSRWSGDLGINWEVANLVTLRNEYGDSRDFVIIKVEGARRSEAVHSIDKPAHLRRRGRYQNWISVKPSKDRSSIQDPLATYVSAGIFDNGCCYAANGFWDPKTSNHIFYGWITEEDLPDEHRHRQGWSGMVSLPRVVRLMTLHNVKRARVPMLQSITSLELMPEASNKQTYTVHSLGIGPDPRLSRLRLGSRAIQSNELSLPAPLTSLPSHLIPLTSGCWELEAEFAVSSCCERVGIQIAHTSGGPPPMKPLRLSKLIVADFRDDTILAWTPSSETFTIHRPCLQDGEINHGYESAPHTLFTFENAQGQDTEEALRVHAFFDKNVLEVFVNDRTVISSRIYHPSSRCFGVRFFTESSKDCPKGERTVLLRANAWDGISKTV